MSQVSEAVSSSRRPARGPDRQVSDSGSEVGAATRADERLAGTQDRYAAVLNAR